MNGQAKRRVALLVAAVGVMTGPIASAQPTFPEPARYQPTADERRQVETKLDKLTRALAGLPRNDAAKREALADVAVFRKAADWVLRLGEFYDKNDVAATLDVIARGLERARRLADGQHPWAEASGSWGRGFVSKVDGSIQPYVVIVPAGLDFKPGADRRARLDVVLHGRDAKLNEVRFLRSHDGKPTDATPGKVTLHVFGRTNNAYRWAGETDVFEAIEAVKRNYPIDDQRIVLRGFSMGGAGAWHLGLHYPALWSSVEAGAGFTETMTYAKLGAFPDVPQKMLHIYDAVDYAANTFNVAIAGYGGENDPQRQAAINIQKALEALDYPMTTEGLITRAKGIDFLRVEGAGTGHSVDRASAKVLSEFHDAHAVRGVDPAPRRIRFVTYTVKYNEAAWLALEQLQTHYRRASIDAEIDDKRVVIKAIENVAVFSVDRHAAESIQIGEQEFPLERAVKGLLPNVYFRLVAGEWQQLDYDASRGFQENADRVKQHNVQGPIDDAFTGPFLCVRGTGTPWNRQVHSWADARVGQFARDWTRWMRGDLPIKDDTEITADDIEGHHLVLFGDPGSNRVLGRVLARLPVVWTRKEVTLGERFDAANHVPVLVAPNPLNVRRYVVINSGHTFGATEFAGTNALLFPRLGDYAVFAVDDRDARPRLSGIFDERWRLRPN